MSGPHSEVGGSETSDDVILSDAEERRHAGSGEYNAENTNLYGNEKDKEESISDNSERSFEERDIDAEPKVEDEFEETVKISLEGDAIAPVAPKIVEGDELGQVSEVSSSPAFQCLDDLFMVGELTGTRVAQLKAKYTALHNLLNKKRQSELRQIEDKKKLVAKLEHQKEELEKADAFPEGFNDDVSQLRINLLKCYNDFDLIGDRNMQWEYKLDNLKAERDMMQREYSRMPKKDEVEKQIAQLKSSSEVLVDEIAQRLQEIKQYKEDLEKCHKETDVHLKLLQEELTKREDLKSELVIIHGKPQQLVKECDKLTRQKEELEVVFQSSNETYKELSSSFRDNDTKQRELECLNEEVMSDLANRKVSLQSKQREFDTLLKDYETNKETQNKLKGDKATIDLSMKHIKLEKQRLHEANIRHLREKDAYLKTVKRTELQLRVATEALFVNREIYEKTKSDSALLPKDDSSESKKSKEFQREVEATKRALTQENSLTSVEARKVEQCIKEEQKLRYDQSEYKIELVELTRIAALKADEREAKAREFVKSELKHQRAEDELKGKKVEIKDHAKKLAEMQVKLGDFAKLYDVIKDERSKCVNLIQVSQQKATEMKEKFKILSNETEILRSNFSAKERSLQKARLKHMNSLVIRDAIRNDLSKQRKMEEDSIEVREQQRMDLSKMNKMINATEEQMVQLRKRFESAVQRRNDGGIELIERNEEVCIFYEKLNIQNTTLCNGGVDLMAKDEEMRFLGLQTKELHRSIDLLRKEIPKKKSLEIELQTLRDQESEMQIIMRALGERLENGTDKERLRHLPGKDGDQEELNSRIEDYETRLVEKEESLLEKQLLYDQVSRLCDRVRNKSEAGKDDTLNLAKKVNEYQSKIKELTRKMMAKVSELSMLQASALKSQQEVKYMETELEQGYIRLERGEAPTQEAMVEWEKLVRAASMVQRDLMADRVRKEEEDQYVTQDGMVTTAEPRPNAYIPDNDDELPIPRPYGGHAPFKPQEQGSNMRHFRKPIVKPIEI